MADQGGRSVPPRADQAGGIPGQRPAVITTRRLVAAAIAAKVDRYNPGTGKSA